MQVTKLKIGQKELIDFFSKHKADYAETGKGKKELIRLFNAKDWVELTGKEEFSLNFEPVRSLNNRLNEWTKGPSAKKQVQACLFLLRHYSLNNPESDQFEILKHLIKNVNKKSLFYSWPNSMQDYFNKGFQVIFQWKDFFFSYTNRNVPETNNDFKKFITHCLKKNEYRRNWEDINYLAKVIVRHLTRRNLIAFFDRDNIKCGDDFKNKIFIHCKSCFVFIQLIEEEVFARPGNKRTNWCHLEFKAFNDWTKNAPAKWKKRHFFILSHEPSMVFPKPLKEYKTWQDKVKATEYVAIIHGLKISEFREKIIALANEIDNTKDEIIKYYLGDFFDNKLQ